MVLKNLILIILGFILLGLGAVGVALPVLPTTPFVLLAAVYFSASTRKPGRRVMMTLDEAPEI